MILVIRIAGAVDIDHKVEETLFRMRLRRKYAAVLLHDTAENRKLLLSVRDFIAYGVISNELLEKIIKLRGKSMNKKDIDAKKVAEGLAKKSLDELGVKPFFRLHPPRKGIDSKHHAGVGKGVLGEHKDISQLVERML